MTRLQIVLTIALSTIRAAAAILRLKDQNDSGLDDEAAAALEFAVERIEKFLDPQAPPV